MAPSPNATTRTSRRPLLETYPLVWQAAFVLWSLHAVRRTDRAVDMPTTGEDAFPGLQTITLENERRREGKGRRGMASLAVGARLGH